VATYEVVLSRISGTACLNAAHPVFREANDENGPFKDLNSSAGAGDLLNQPVRTDIIGVLVLCIPLSQLGGDTGLDQLFSDRRIRLMQGGNRRDYLRDPRGFTSSIILVSDSGQLLFPDVDGVSDSIPMIDQLKQSSIPGLYNVAYNVMQGKEGFAVLPAGK